MGILLLRGVARLRFNRDLQAVSLALVGALSFLFAYEALFKLCFYLAPRSLPPAELREFILQAAVALTGMVGFAFGKYRLSHRSLVFLAAYLLGMALWLAIGFPQLGDEMRVYTHCGTLR